MQCTNRIRASQVLYVIRSEAFAPRFGVYCSTPHDIGAQQLRALGCQQRVASENVDANRAQTSKQPKTPSASLRSGRFKSLQPFAVDYNVFDYIVFVPGMYYTFLVGSRVPSPIAHCTIQHYSELTDFVLSMHNAIVMKQPPPSCPDYCLTLRQICVVLIR